MINSWVAMVLLRLKEEREKKIAVKFHRELHGLEVDTGNIFFLSQHERESCGTYGYTCYFSLWQRNLYTLMFFHYVGNSNIMACTVLYKCIYYVYIYRETAKRELHVAIISEAPVQFVFSSLWLHSQGDYLHKMALL